MAAVVEQFDEASPEFHCLDEEEMRKVPSYIEIEQQKYFMLLNCETDNRAQLFDNILDVNQKLKHLSCELSIKMPRLQELNNILIQFNPRDLDCSPEERATIINKYKTHKIEVMYIIKYLLYVETEIPRLTIIYNNLMERYLTFTAKYFIN